MRAISRPRVARLTVTLGLAMACDSGGAVAELAREHSPLAAAAKDGDRLWLMVRAAGLTTECGRLETRTGFCEEHESHLLDFLHANGVPDARLDHLQSPAFWAWMREHVVAIDACQEQQRRAGGPSTPCDPYERLRVEGPRLSRVLQIPESARLDADGILAVDLPGEPLAETRSPLQLPAVSR
jgi:hypothetical protein